MSNEKLAAIAQKDEGLRWIADSVRDENKKRADVWRKHEAVQVSQARTTPGVKDSSET